MAWFNKTADQQKFELREVQLEAKQMPETNFEVNDYEKYIWMAYANCCDNHVRRTVRWDKLEVEYYKATLENGDVIFFEANDNNYRIVNAQEAKFNTEKDWLREFARRFNYMLRKKNVNQQDLSDRTGISKSALSYYINCKRIPSAFTLKLIADELGTTVSFLSNF